MSVAHLQTKPSRNILRKVRGSVVLLVTVAAVAPSCTPQPILLTCRGETRRGIASGDPVVSEIVTVTIDQHAQTVAVADYGTMSIYTATEHRENEVAFKADGKPMDGKAMSGTLNRVTGEIQFAIAANTARFVTWGFRGVCEPARAFF
jgi:hypothetical protein